MAFLASFIQYLVIFIILVGIAILGFFLGKLARTKSDAKKAAQAASEAKETVALETVSAEGETDDKQS